MISELKPLFGKYEFLNLGRNKVNKVVELSGEKSLWEAIKPHFMSNDIEYEYDPDTGSGKIFVGGFREVGQFRRVHVAEMNQIKEGE